MAPDRPRDPTERAAYRGVDRRAGYRGADRRGGTAAVVGTPFDWRFRLAVAACLAVGSALLAAGLWLEGADDADGALDLLLGAAAVAGALAAAALSGLRWRVSGSAPALWVSGAMLCASAHVGAFHLAAQVTDHDLVAQAGVGVGAAALVLLAGGSASPEVDDRSQPLALSAVAVVVGAVVTGLLALGEVELDGPPHLGSAELEVVLAVAWLTVAALAVRCARARGGATFAAAGVLGLALAVHWGVTAALRALDGSPPDGHLLVLVLGCAFAALGSGWDLQATFAVQRSELLRSKVSATQLEAQAAAARLVAEERLHEARNALAAIDGATRILERHHDRLPPEERTALAGAVGAEVARLQLLIAADVGEHQRATFDVAEALAPAITGARALGLEVETALPAGVTGFGSWSSVAGVVQNLLENVRRHAPGSPALVSAAVEGDRLVVTVADRGPGLPPGQEEAIFGRGARGAGSAAVPGTGLGLDIARRTVRRQGGELRYEARPGGGAVFVIELPTAGRSAAPEEAGPAPS